MSQQTITAYSGLIETYHKYLPLTKDTPIISLQEGNTPLIQLQNLPKKLNWDIDVYVKYEGLNPTGSFKDRGMTVAVSHAVSEGTQAIMCASTGNTSAAAAAYGARANISTFVLIPEGNIALGKLAQARIHGATVIQIKGNFDEAMQLVKTITQALPITLVNSVNPYRLHGQKTAAFEIVDVLGDAPDYHCLPVGNAGNISAYWMGYQEYHQHKLCKQLPTMLGFQASNAAPFLTGHPIDNPETIATAIRIGRPQSWDLAINATHESNGWFDHVSDDDILSMQRLLAECDGIFCEPASAASLAGLDKTLQQQKIKSGSTVVCTLTGHGLKDPDIAINNATSPIITVEPELNAINTILQQHLN